MSILEEATTAATEATNGSIPPAALRAALAAAAPILMAEAWDEGAEAVIDDGNDSRARNPYYT